MPVEKHGLPIRAFETTEAFRRWLHRQHDSAAGVWLKIAKKGSGVDSVTYADAVDVALCYGWIDGQKDRYDDAWFLQRFTPRRPRSNWSRANCNHVERLIADGLMQPAGLAQVEMAKADGRWAAAYAGSRSITIPDDFQAALDANVAARDSFAALNRTDRYSFLYRINQAKRPATRASRIEKFVEVLAAGRTLR